MILTPAVITGAFELVDFIMAARKAMLERGEWTEAHEAAFREKGNALFKEPHWQIDGQPIVKHEQ